MTRWPLRYRQVLAGNRYTARTRLAVLGRCRNPIAPSRNRRPITAPRSS